MKKKVSVCRDSQTRVHFTHRYRHKHRKITLNQLCECTCTPEFTAKKKKTEKNANFILIPDILNTELVCHVMKQKQTQFLFCFQGTIYQHQLFLFFGKQHLYINCKQVTLNKNFVNFKRKIVWHENWWKC